jgi:CRP/FNR family transcriptional regulator, cyclic AMP receptor protein
MQGEVADAVFFIQKGRVKVTVTSDHGKDAVVGILAEGQFFGEGCLHGQPLRTATSKALCHCRITSITKAVMISAIRDQPKLSKLFMDHLLSRNGRIEEDIIDQLFNSSEKRLARLLLLLANYGKEGSPPIVSVSLNQETLAEMIGTTRSRVSFFMNKFRKLGSRAGKLRRDCPGVRKRMASDRGDARRGVTRRPARDRAAPDQ